MAFARKVTPPSLKREHNMDVAKSHASISDIVPVSIDGNIRTLVPSNRSPNAIKPSDDITGSSDVIAAGAASIADIERLMAELQAARDYLLAEGERVRRANANYAHLAQTASASARVIVESIGKWRIPEQVTAYKPPTALSPGACSHVGTLAEAFEVEPALEKMEQQLTQMTASSKPQ
jgi:hypothetical protein